MILDDDAEGQLLAALKASLDEIEFGGRAVEVHIDEPMSLTPMSVVLNLASIERRAETVSETELGSYDWTLTVEAQVFVEITSRTTNAQATARQYVEALIRTIDTETNLRTLLEDDPVVTRAERVGPTEDTQKRVFEAWTADIVLPALVTY